MWCQQQIDRPRSVDVLRLTRGPAGLQLAESPNTTLRGWDGTYYTQGRRHHTGDHPEYDYRISARGLGADLGVMHALYKQSPSYRRSVLNVMQGVESAIWQASLPKNLSATPALRLIRRWLDGQWSGLDTRQFLHEAVYSLCVPGFGIWIRVDHPDGRIKQLAYRRPNSIERFLFNDDETEIVGVEFRDMRGVRYAVPRAHLVTMSFDKLGLDLEGVSPLRTAAPYIKAKQIAQKLEMATLEKYAMPIVVIDDAGDTIIRDAAETQAAISVWDNFSADDFPVIKGANASILHPAGTMPDYNTLKRYFDEQISLPLSNEGAHLGQGQHGSYALSKVKDDQNIRTILYIGDIIAEAIHEQVSGVLMRRFWQVGPMEAPIIGYSLGEDETPIEDIYRAVELGILPVTPELASHIADRLAVPQAEIAPTPDPTEAS